MNYPGKLLRYSASAGSGKTHALTGFYLSRILADPGSYRRILAVTFTNSAAAEMKGRILTRLNNLGSDTESGRKEREEFVRYLCSNFPDIYPEPGKTELMIRKNAPTALKNILQDYSRFTVGTIDSFFQRVIRSFAREMDLPSGYEIELEHEALLTGAVEELLATVSTDRKLKEWISSYVFSRLDDNRSWDISREIGEVASQIFSEPYRQLNSDERKRLGDYDTLEKYTGRVFGIKRHFEAEIRRLASEGVKIFSAAGLTPDDFYKKRKGGVGEMLVKYAGGFISRPGATWQAAVDEGRLLPEGAAEAVRSAAETAKTGGLNEILKNISGLFDTDYPLYIAAVAQVKTLHVVGILGAISEKVRVLAHDENLFLLSDSGELINRLIADDDTPFIYEKIGTAYDHYIIDEFQDTSRIQWNNFRPLIAETLARGNDNLVVGDVKQSIYRWRNSDWRILHSEVEEDFGKEIVRTIALDTNYRSRKAIIDFNNRLFSPRSVPAMCDMKLDYEGLRLEDIYEGSMQQGTPEKEGGFVDIAFYRKTDNNGWKENVLAELPALVEELQDQGYRAEDILFLCRTNEEGKNIISRILEYSSTLSDEKRNRYNYEVTSGDSLYLESNPAVTLIISALRFITEPADRINSSLMMRSHSLATGGDNDYLVSADLEDGSGRRITEIWKEELAPLKNSGLFDATEKLIAYFNLGTRRENVAYLSALQDIVLWYSSRYGSDTGTFISWWEEEGFKKTLGQSDRQEAMSVMTIHKAKGLQSRVVIVPFAAWGFGSRGFGKPLLWISDVPEPFDIMPVVLPEVSSDLEESLFREEALREKAAEWLDGVNLLYVALTRAVDALYIMTPDMEKVKSSGNNVANLLNDALKESAESFRITEAGSARHLSTGMLPQPAASVKMPSMTMSAYRVSGSRGRLRLKTGSTVPLDDIKLEEAGGRVYGILMHELLSHVITLDDVSRAVEIVCHDGLYPAADSGRLRDHLLKLLNSEKVKDWFDGSYEVRTEAAVILPSGNTRRPDRIMFGNDRVIVADYKFGEPSDHYIRQARAYRDLLTEMGYRNVDACIWYVEKNIVVAV